ncbi:hypothetical protein QA645_25250 [Bradyrhizobium sp. CIAT3101]|uniref:hypothetical protein n=1 Tax=Bradyrhizobium sp. CIAT3101 TaxID=439387 RepID=UPI0024B21592|nr:hypothetical protein [Bradyrhizobium sp. CIAT3101]WFU77852.1 hypothetical protein QA645_25250 [Bradyrhizobium sp. CIAT3101]
MLEIGIFCVILLAAGYWATMFVMGRRDDVIHGKFVHSEDEGAFTQPAMPAPPPFPKRPVKAAQPAHVQPAKAQPEMAEARQVSSAALESLLAAIQQDLKSVA